MRKYLPHLNVFYHQLEMLNWLKEEIIVPFMYKLNKKLDERILYVRNYPMLKLNFVIIKIFRSKFIKKSSGS